MSLHTTAASHSNARRLAANSNVTPLAAHSLRAHSASYSSPTGSDRTAQWITRLAIFALLLISAASQSHAQEIERIDQVQSGSLLLKMKNGYQVATRINSDIELSVSGMVVRTTLRQSFRNDGADWVEGIYVFPLPETAAVDHMRFTVGNRVIEGEIREKEEAKKQYEAAKREGRKASLVSQQRANLFTSRLANLGPGETIDIEIEYLDTAVFEDGEFSLRIPTTLTPRFIPGRSLPDRQGSGWSPDTDRVPDASLITPPQVTSSIDHRLSLRAVIDAGMALESVVSRYHPIKVSEQDDIYELRFSVAATQMDHDVELVWRPVAAEAPRALLFSEVVDDQTHLLLMLVPPTEPVVGAAMPRELVFVVDTSGSMNGVSIAQAKSALLLALDGLRPMDRFNVIQFDSNTQALFPGSVDAQETNIERARAYVRGLQADGGTNMYPALVRALGGNDDGEYLKQIIFITDGSVGNEGELFTLIEDRLGRARLFTVGIGSAPNGWFMQKAAEAGRGSQVTISALHEVQEKMQKLFRKLEQPQVTDVSVTWPSGVSARAYPAPVPDLYAGEPVIVKARTDGELADNAVISVGGRSNGGPWYTQVELDTGIRHAGTAAVWARAHIDSLLEQRRRGGDADELRAAVIDTALQHHLVSEFTSMVAVDKTPVRPEGATLTEEQVPNLLPYGQNQEAIFGFPATATNAPLARQLGIACLLLAGLMLAMRRRQPGTSHHAPR